MKIVLATENKAKLAEMQSFLQTHAFTVLSQKDFNIPPIEETGLSFIENALLKARHCAKLTHLPTLADDSGLVVDALDGQPGIYSARYAGINAKDNDNIEKLLNNLSRLQNKNRRAHFYCALAFMRHETDPVPIIAQAKWDGLILTEKRGHGGFGYDPVFYIPALHCTAAELKAQQKNTLSHRAKALFLFCEQFKLMNSDV